MICDRKSVFVKQISPRIDCWTTRSFSHMSELLMRWNLQVAVLTTSGEMKVKRSVAGQPKPVHFKVNEVKDGFMSSPERAEELIKLIDDLVALKITQDNIDRWYESFIEVYHDEMSKFYKKLDPTLQSKKLFYLLSK